MSDRLRESLSALVDGEASEFELRRVLDRDDPSLRASWNDYHRLRHVMVDGGLPHASLDISAGVAEAIAAEGRRRSWRDLAKPLGGVAVAASVAAVVVFGVRGIEQGGVGQQLAGSESAATGRVYPVMQGDNVSVGSDSYPPATTATQAPASEEAAQVVLERFERYMERHAERAALNSPQGMVSYARVVSHEAD